MVGDSKARRRAVQEACADNPYAMLHAPRYAVLLELLDGYVRPGSRILDLGRSRLTTLLHDTYGVPVDNLGFEGNHETPEGTSYWFDLNMAQKEDNWRRDMPAYDVIVMAEVIEHLHTAPTLVLRFMKTLLAENGILVVQTPNAVALHKRLQMLAGRHPYEQIREALNDPGHFREYTRSELEAVARSAGFAVEAWIGKAYFDYRYAPGAPGASETRNRRVASSLLNLAYRVLPAGMRPGQTLVLRHAR